MVGNGGGGGRGGTSGSAEDAIDRAFWAGVYVFGGRGVEGAGAAGVFLARELRVFAVRGVDDAGCGVDACGVPGVEASKYVAFMSIVQLNN